MDETAFRIHKDYHLYISTFFFFFVSLHCDSDIKNLPAMFNLWVSKIPWRREWHPAPVFLPGEFHGERILEATVHGLAKSQTWLSNFPLIEIIKTLQLIIFSSKYLLVYVCLLNKCLFNICKVSFYMFGAQGMKNTKKIPPSYTDTDGDICFILR